MSKPKPDVGPCSQTASGEHCWHELQEQHTLGVVGGRHIDDGCCWCGVKRCYNVFGDQTASVGTVVLHGPHEEVYEEVAGG